jgi:exodeoxyribonuclease VII large subunit
MIRVYYMSDVLFQEQQHQLTDKPVKEISEYIKWVATQKNRDEVGNVLVFYTHKSVAVRRLVAQTVAIIGTEQVIPHLETWKTTESDRKTWVMLESAIDRITRRKDGDESETHALTVSEALTLIRSVVSEKTYTIEGEISEKNIYGQMYYFSLKDTNDAVIGCSCYATTIYRAYFPLNEGLAIRVNGKFKINQKSSRLYFDVQSMELTGEGELMRNLKLLQEKLEHEGIIDPTRKRTPRKLPERILLFASPNSAALTDYTKVISARRGGLSIYHFPIKTQGVGVEEELLSAFTAAKKLVSQYSIDTIIITRGGGSKEDLMAFNSEFVARAIHALPCPTIVAIGHERDITIAELVADVRASTPSQAAELSSLSAQEVVSHITSINHQIINYFQEKNHSYKRFVDQILFVTSTRIRHEIQQYRAKSAVLDATVTRTLFSIRSNNTQSVQYIISTTSNTIQRLRHETAVLYTAITQHLLQEVTQSRTKSELLTTKITIEHPANVLKKGYALLSLNGSDITSVKQLVVGDTLTLTLADGAKQAEITS